MAEFIGRVSSIDETDGEGRPSMARILPGTASQAVTMPFAVHESLRAGGLAPGDEVVCLQFGNGSGLVLCRPDGTT